MTSPGDWGRGDTRRLSQRDYPAAVLALVDERQGSRRCAFCGSFDQLELDHRQPLSRGGDNHHLNLQWACLPCNRSKGNRRRPKR